MSGIHHPDEPSPPSSIAEPAPSLEPAHLDALRQEFLEDKRTRAPGSIPHALFQVPAKFLAQRSFWPGITLTEKAPRLLLSSWDNKLPKRDRERERERGRETEPWKVVERRQTCVSREQEREREDRHSFLECAHEDDVKSLP